MPKRVVDGEALWLSQKVRSLPAEYRLHYANWLPLAEANGVFEANANQIWARVYSFLLPDMTEKKVQKVLDALISADLVKIWKENGKTWGYFKGIEKSGRLPSAKHLNRYKNLPPDAPQSRIIRDSPGESETIPLGSGLVLDRIGSGSDSSSQSGQEEKETEMAFNQNLEVIAAKILKFTKGMSPKEKSEFKLLSRAYSTDRIEQDFEAWAEENRGGNARYPFSLYLTKIKDRLESEPEPEIVDDGRVRYIAGKIYEMTGRLPVGPAQIALVKLLQKYESSDIIAAFSEYLSSLDAFETKWAVKNFFTEGGAEIVIEKRLKDLESNKRMQEQIAQEIADTAQAEQIEDKKKKEAAAELKKHNEEYADQI